MFAQIDSQYSKKSYRRTIVRLFSYLYEGRPLTTKGRFFNRYLFLFFNLIKKINVISENHNLSYIVGTGRSGTTILGVILSMHNKLGFLNEPKALWYSSYKNEDLIGNYSNGEYANYHLTEMDMNDNVRKSFHALYSFYAKATASSVIIDKYPEALFRQRFCQAIDQNAKFLALVRNGWDTIYSIEKWSERLGVRVNGDTHDWWGVNNKKWHLLLNEVVSKDSELHLYVKDMEQWTNQTHMAAVEWIVSMKKCLELVKASPDSVKLIKYEDLCLRSDEVLIDILDFLGVEEDQNMLDYAKNTLKPNLPKEESDLPDCIQSSFYNTMFLLGYK